MSLKEKMTGLADAVREKAGVIGLLSIDGMTAAVKGIQTGGSVQTEYTGHVDDKKIWFIDYNGTILDSWEVSELSGKTALPEAPVHDGLTAQGWNWTLEELKAFGRPAIVGQCYEPTDGKTKIYISLSVKRDIDFLLNYSSGVTCTVDWGDGNQTTVKSSLTDTRHSYTEAGDYVIAISADSGSYTLGRFRYYDTIASQQDEGNSFVKKVFLASNANLIHAGFDDCAGLKEVIISAGSELANNAFNGCKQLLAAVIPPGKELPSSCFGNCSALECVSLGPDVEILPSSLFYNCYSLRAVTLTDKLTKIGSSVFCKCENLRRIEFLSENLEITDSTSYLFFGCVSLEEISLPEEAEEIVSSTFGNCTNLQKVVLPATVTEISSTYAFSNCQAMYQLYVKAEEPPTGVSGMFSDFLKDCTIYVPESSLEAYKEAEYWSDYADRMVGMDFSE